MNQCAKSGLNEFIYCCRVSALCFNNLIKQTKAFMHLSFCLFSGPSDSTQWPSLSDRGWSHLFMLKWATDPDICKYCIYVRNQVPGANSVFPPTWINIWRLYNKALRSSGPVIDSALLLCIDMKAAECTWSSWGQVRLCNQKKKEKQRESERQW